MCKNWVCSPFGAAFDSVVIAAGITAEQANYKPKTHKWYNCHCQVLHSINPSNYAQQMNALTPLDKDGKNTSNECCDTIKWRLQNTK